MRGNPEGPAAASEFEALISAYQKLLRDTIVRVCPRDLGLQVDDIEQEVRIRVWRAMQHETNIRDRASYFYKVALTTTIDAIRRVKARREEQLDPANDEIPGDVLSRPAAYSSPEGIAERRQVFRKVAEALARLSPDRRRAAGLYLEGLTLHEIAAVLNWSESRARNLIYRGLSDLRTQLRAAGIDYENE